MTERWAAQEGEKRLEMFRKIQIVHANSIRSCSTPFINCPAISDLTILIYSDRLNSKKFTQAKVIWKWGWRLWGQWKRLLSSRREKPRSAIWRLGRVSSNVTLYHHLVFPGLSHFRRIKSPGCLLLHFGQNCRVTANQFRHLSEQKAAIRMEKDKARMVHVFLELDEDADGL